MNTQHSGYLGLVMRMSNITRWSHMRCAVNENVMEHSAMVAIIAGVLGNLAELNGKVVDWKRLMLMSVLHDASEVLTSDVVQPVKHRNPQIKAEFERIERESEAAIYATLPEPLRDAMSCATMVPPKDHEYHLMKAADLYSAFIKATLELAAGNKTEFGPAQGKLMDAVLNRCDQVEELATLHQLFNAALTLSVDEQLEMTPDAGSSDLEQVLTELSMVSVSSQ